MPTTLTPSMSVVERFSRVSSEDFEHELERIWDGIATVRQSVVEAVREDKLTPIEGVSILACTTGQLLGYQAFHGQPQPAELLPYFTGKQWVHAKRLKSGAATPPTRFHGRVPATAMDARRGERAMLSNCILDNRGCRRAPSMPEEAPR
jgi:hypothetical protein